MTTLDKNKIIAEFMVGKEVETHHNQYHTSWNELIPVVEKIESCYNGSIIFTIKDRRSFIVQNTQEGMIEDIPFVSECYSGICDTKIEAVYKTVVEFITLYNQNKQS